MSDPLYRVMYLSEATRAPSRGELEDLLLGARARNAAHGISGLLLYDGGHFAQVLEGARGDVERLLANIRHDPRHHRILEILAGPVPRRDFEGWAMGWDDLARRKELHLEPLRKLLRTQAVSDPGVAYGALTRFREGLGHEARAGVVRALVAEGK